MQIRGGWNPQTLPFATTIKCMWLGLNSAMGIKTERWRKSILSGEPSAKLPAETKHLTCLENVCHRNKTKWEAKLTEQTVSHQIISLLFEHLRWPTMTQTDIIPFYLYGNGGAGSPHQIQRESKRNLTKCISSPHHYEVLQALKWLTDLTHWPETTATYKQQYS